jgi:hypothetical protein
VRIGEDVAKGYRRQDFVDAWERFLTGSRVGVTSATSVTTAPLGQADVTDVTDVTHERDEWWLARDGVWRSVADEPPHWPGEVVEARNGKSVEMPTR